MEKGGRRIEIESTACGARRSDEDQAVRGEAGQACVGEFGEVYGLAASLVRSAEGGEEVDVGVGSDRFA